MLPSSHSAQSASPCGYPTTRTAGSPTSTQIASSPKLRPNGDHYVYALTDYREVDRSIALARL